MGKVVGCINSSKLIMAYIGNFSLRMYITAFYWTVICLCNIYAGEFQITGKINNAGDITSMIIKYQIHPGANCIEYHTDTCQVVGGQFVLCGNVDELLPATYEIGKQRFRFYLEPGDISMTIDGNKPYLMQETGTSIDEELVILSTFFRENDSLLMHKFKKAVEFVYETEYVFDDVAEYDRCCQKRKLLLLDFCKKHTSFKIVPDLLCQVIEIDNAGSFEEKQFASLKSVRRLYEKINEESRTSLTGISLEKSIRNSVRAKKAQRHPVGAEMPDLAFSTADGKCISISDYKSKSYVLLHVWSGPCVDCPEERQVIRNFKKAFPKPLEILSVSQEENSKEEWLHNIESCQLEWPQCLDTWQTDLYQLFSTRIVSMLPGSLLPKFILIDQDGKIVAFDDGTLEISGDGSP